MQEKDIYDIIIENCTKEWKKSMAITKLSWEQPQYSKNKIEKAGKILAKESPANAEIIDAAMDDIIKIDPLGIYMKIAADDTPLGIPVNPGGGS